MNTKALIVAISRYSNPRNNLPAVENDVSSIVGTLSTIYGINDLEIIRNENATSHAIKSALNNLVSGSSDGDVRIFYFSGHGTIVPTNNKDSQKEAFVSYECSSSTLIMDEWLGFFLRETLPPTCTFWGIYDCCHSGNLYKSTGILSSEPPQAKFLPFKDLLIDSPEIFLPNLGMLGRNMGTKNLILDDSIENSFHLGASEASKPALCLPIEGKSRSVFTYALSKACRKDQTLSAFEKEVSSISNGITTEHTPQIASSQDLKETLMFRSASNTPKTPASGDQDMISRILKRA